MVKFTSRLFSCLLLTTSLSTILVFAAGTDAPSAPTILPPPPVISQPTQAPPPVVPTQVVPPVQSSDPIQPTVPPSQSVPVPVTNPITAPTQQPIPTSGALSYSTITTVINGVTKVIVQTITPSAQQQPQSQSPALTQSQTIIIAVVGVVLVLLILIFALLCIRRKRKRNDIMYRPDMYQSVNKDTPLQTTGNAEQESNETQNNLHNINGQSDPNFGGHEVFYGDQYYPHDQDAQPYYYDGQLDNSNHDQMMMNNQDGNHQQAYFEGEGQRMDMSGNMHGQYQDENGYFYTMPENGNESSNGNGNGYFDHGQANQASNSVPSQEPSDQVPVQPR